MNQPNNYDHNLQLVGGDEFLESMKHESKDWIIPGIALPGSSLMVYAREGIGKSRLMAQLASSLIYGTPFMGMPIYKTGPVISLQLDMPPNEWDLLLCDAKAEGLGLDSSSFLTLHKDNKHFSIDDPQMKEWLCDMYATHKPICLMLDSIKNAFTRSPKSNEDLNQFVLRLLNDFRSCCPKSLFQYTLHDRKAPARINEETLEQDMDSHGELPQYVRDASVVMRLFQNKKDEIKLLINKHRLGPVGWKKLQIEMNENGFFFPAEMDHRIMLISWPNFIPAKERAEVIASVKTKQDVYRDIAKRSLTAEGTVKRYAIRSEVEYMWEKLL